VVGIMSLEKFHLCKITNLLKNILYQPCSWFGFAESMERVQPLWDPPIFTLLEPR